VSHDDDELVGRGYDNRLMRRLLGYVRPYRWQVAMAVVVVLADSIVGLAGPYLTKEAIDNGIRHHDRIHLDLVAKLYLTMLVMGFGLGYLHTQIMQRVGQRIMLDLRMQMFRHLQRLPLSYFDRTAVGRIMTRVTNDVDTLNDLFTTGMVSAAGDAFLLIGIIVAMVHLNAELLAVAFSVLPLIVIVTLVFRSGVRRSFRDIRNRLARLNAHLNESLGGINTLQLMNREDRSRAEFQALNAAHRDANMKAVLLNAALFPVLELVGAIAVSLIVWYGGRQVMWTGITLGTLVAFLQYTQRFFRPISDLSEKYSVLQQAMASSERIFGLLDTPGDAADAVGPADPAASTAEPIAVSKPGVASANGPGADGRSPRIVPITRPPAHGGGRIEFDHVWFAYGGEHWVLEDVSFAVEPGERVALVGATGSGKTTVISLLLRFYEPQRGEIRVDGVPLRSWDVTALRSRMGVVLQDVFLFSGTVESNLRLAAPAEPLPTLERAAREARAHDFIERLPGGYGEPVVERGATLSGGQRQLLSFARALARDPELLLLDEATSSVDTHTESLIQDGLQRIMRGRTCLVVAHRLSTIQNSDRIVVLHHGRVRETGTHDQLVAAGGIYARLYELQVLGAGRRVRPERTSPFGVEPLIVDDRLNMA
jgi:ATP-binding cassette subfamily B protein